MLFCWFHCLLNEGYYSVSRYKGALKSITMNLDFTFWQWRKQNSYSKRLPITMLLKLNKTWFERYWWVHNKETLQDYKLNRNNYQLHPDDCSKWYMIQSVTKSCLTLCDPMDCSLQAPLSMGFPRQNTGVGSQSLLQRIFLTQESLGSPALQADSLLSEPPRKPNLI